MKVKFKKIKENLKNWPKILAKKAFLTFLVLVLLFWVLGIIIFYKYSLLPEKTEPIITEKPFRFKKETYQDILETWQVRQGRFEKTEIKLYLNPFGGF